VTPTGRRDTPFLPALRPEEAEAFDSDTDTWGWVEADHDHQVRFDLSGMRVTAVLVTFDAARWLPATLESLAQLQHRPTRLIAIDNDSIDGTRQLLDQALAEGLIDAVYTGKRRFGFGAAVKWALRQDGQHGAAESHWLWLLHDDAQPAPDALSQMLSHIRTDRTIDVTGPKLLLPRRRQVGQQISEVGVSISGTGRRDLQLDSGEIDQGQRDQPQSRLGVSTCGMLVRTKVWNELGGLDPEIPVFRDGVEFGWRAHLNGYRVVTTPSAEMTHRQVGRAGLRPAGVTGRRPGMVDRLLGMVVVAGHAPAKLLPLIFCRLVWSCLLQAVGYLLGKVPGRALDEILALGSFLAHPGRIVNLRRRTAAIDPVPGTEEVIHALRPPWWNSLRVAAEAMSGAIAERYRSVAGDADAASLDELTGDDFSSVADERPKNMLLSPMVLIAVLAAVGSVVAARGLIGRGALAAPALLPAYDRLGALWQAVLSPIPGAPSQISPPWLTLTAVGSTVLAGQPEWFSTLLLCGVVPLSLLAAYPVIRRVINERRLRWWVATTYALLPVLLGGTNQGRLGLSVVAIGLPLLVQAVRALVLRRVGIPEAWRGGWGSGVVLVALVAFEPSLIIPALLLGVLGTVMLRRTPRKIGRIGIALGLPLLLLAPWWPSVLAEPGRLFVGPDAALGGAPTAPAVWALLLGRDVGPGLPPLWVGAVVFGVIWLVALIGLVRRPDRRTVMSAWIVALLGLAMAVVLSRLVVTVPPIGTEVRPWVGSYLLITFAALLIGGGVGVDGLAAEMRERSFSWLQPAAALAGVAVGLVSLGAATWWVLDGAQGPIERTRLDTIPPYVMNGLRSPARPRLLAIDVTGGIARYSVLADGHLRLGDADRGAPFGGSVRAREHVDDVVGRLIAGTADADIRSQLGALGIGYLWVTGAAEDIISRIDNTPGLGTASGTDRGTVWQLSPAVGRSTVVSRAGTEPLARPPVAIPADGPDRSLQIGEAADPRWQATIDGRPLSPADGDWQQAYALPAAGGTVTWSIPSSVGWLLIGQGAVLLVAAVLAAPGVRRPEVRDPTKSARRAATLSELVT
jgi:GT2 family glycosyltransferase